VWPPHLATCDSSTRSDTTRVARHHQALSLTHTLCFEQNAPIAKCRVTAAWKSRGWIADTLYITPHFNKPQGDQGSSGVGDMPGSAGEAALPTAGVHDGSAGRIGSAGNMEGDAGNGGGRGAAATAARYIDGTPVGMSQASVRAYRSAFTAEGSHGVDEQVRSIGTTQTTFADVKDKFVYPFNQSRLSRKQRRRQHRRTNRMARAGAATVGAGRESWTAPAAPLPGGLGATRPSTTDVQPRRRSRRGRRGAGGRDDAEVTRARIRSQELVEEADRIAESLLTPLDVTPKALAVIQKDLVRAFPFQKLGSRLRRDAGANDVGRGKDGADGGASGLGVDPGMDGPVGIGGGGAGGVATGDGMVNGDGVLARNRAAVEQLLTSLPVTRLIGLVCHYTYWHVMRAKVTPKSQHLPKKVRYCRWAATTVCFAHSRRHCRKPMACTQQFCQVSRSMTFTCDPWRKESRVCF